MSKSETNPNGEKAEKTRVTRFLFFVPSILSSLVSDFDIRISDFPSQSPHR